MENEAAPRFVLRLSKNIWNRRRCNSTADIDFIETSEECLDIGERKRSLSSLESNPISFECLSPRKKSSTNWNPIPIERNISLEEFSAQSEYSIKKFNAYSSLMSSELLRSPPKCSGETESSALGSLRCKDIINHCSSLHLENIQKLMLPLIQKLMQHPKNLNMFNTPVDPIALEIPDYFIKIKNPMDLGTVKSLLQRGKFESLEQIRNLICSVFDNAMEYNDDTHAVHEAARDLKSEFETDLDIMLEKISREEERKTSHYCSLCFGTPCALCGEKCLKLELPVLMCNGSCGLRIKRNSQFYITADASRQWCQKCFCSLPHLIESSNGPAIFKREVLKRKCEEEVVESWVDCGTCGCRVHEICALYSCNFLVESPVDDDTSGGTGLELGSFRCPTCILDSAKDSSAEVEMGVEDGLVIDDSELFNGSPNCKHGCNSSDGAVTDTEQDHDMDHIGVDCANDVDDSSLNDDTGSEISGCSTSENTATDCPLGGTEGVCCGDDTHNCCNNKPNVLLPREQKQALRWSASSLPRSKLSDFLETMVFERLHSAGYGSVAKTVTIRMVSNVDQYTEVPSAIQENMTTASGNKLPQYIPFRQKCILMFQEIDGVDVCLFCLYLQEFDRNCPEPNRSTIYIAYLDSVEYFRPMEARTMVYHELLVAYLQWSQFRGFERCHIWSCPPQRGDNFIFWCHPPYQRTPSRDRLGSWYSAMLARATTLGVLDKTTNLYAAYFSDYSKRDKDISTCRQASRNSFVGQGYVSKHSNSAEAGRELSLCNPLAPVSPPIFEGDFWVNECLKVYRIVLNRAKSGDGSDKMANHRDARELIKHLMSKPIAQPFNMPVDPIALNIPNYFSIISDPMDLKTIQDRIRGNNYYTNLLQFAQDVRLTFRNAMTFNPAGHFVYESAQVLAAEFHQSLFEVMVARQGVIADIDNLDSWLAILVLRDEQSVPVPPLLGRGKSVDFFPSIPRNSSTVSALTIHSDPDEDEMDVGSNKELTANHYFSEDSSRISDTGDDPWAANTSNPNPTAINCNFAENDGCDDIIRRSYTSRACMGPPPANTFPAGDEFKKPQLGFRGAASLMLELSKSVQRLKDDLFVATFADPDSVIRKYRERSNLKQDRRYSPTPVNQSPAKQSRGKGRPPLIKKLDVKFASDIVSDNCLSILEKLPRDTSDPDIQMLCPISDTRHTFLELCQFRYYQFDSLRRAKHSSVALLYHLHNPFATHLRPTCKSCANVITDIRWHCEQCLNFDICGPCNTMQTCDPSCKHEHDLTPIRVTFI